MKHRILISLLSILSLLSGTSCLKEDHKDSQPIPKTTTDTPSVATYAGQHITSVSHPVESFLTFGYSNESQLSSYTNADLPDGWTLSLNCSPLIVRIDINQTGEKTTTVGAIQASDFVFDLYGHIVSMKYSSQVAEKDTETQLPVNSITQSYDCTYEYDTDGRMQTSTFKVSESKIVNGTEYPQSNFTRELKYTWKTGCIESVEGSNDYGSSSDIDTYKTTFTYTNAPNMGNIWPYTLFYYGVLDYAYPYDKVMEPVYMEGYFGKFSDNYPQAAVCVHYYKVGGEEKTETVDSKFSFDFNSSYLIAKEYNLMTSSYYLYSYSY